MPITHRHIALLACCTIALTLLTPLPATSAQPVQRCFAETGLCVSGRLLEFWEQNGGLPVFGLPITPQREELIEGKPVQVQWFERNRLELHPENARPYDVLLGRLGADYVESIGSNVGREPAGGPDCIAFPNDYSVCGVFAAAWRASGIELDGQPGLSEAESLALWGLPVTEVAMETLSDGQRYEVQWFERGRFELHPENEPASRVLFGLLGSEALARPVQCQVIERLPQTDPDVALALQAIPGPTDRLLDFDFFQRLDNWAILAGTLDSFEAGIYLLERSGEGYTLRVAWGGISDHTQRIRRSFQEEAPSAPPTLISCLSRTAS